MKKTLEIFIIPIVVGVILLAIEYKTDFFSSNTKEDQFAPPSEANTIKEESKVQYIWEHYNFTLTELSNNGNLEVFYDRPITHPLYTAIYEFMNCDNTICWHGLVDANNKIILEPKYSIDIDYFCGVVMFAEINDNTWTNGKWIDGKIGCIKLDGEILLPLQSAKIFMEEDGSSISAKINGRYAYDILKEILLRKRTKLAFATGELSSYTLIKALSYECMCYEPLLENASYINGYLWKSRKTNLFIYHDGQEFHAGYIDSSQYLLSNISSINILEFNPYSFTGKLELVKSRDEQKKFDFAFVKKNNNFLLNIKNTSEQDVLTCETFYLDTNK